MPDIESVIKDFQLLPLPRYHYAELGEGRVLAAIGENKVIVSIKQSDGFTNWYSRPLKDLEDVAAILTAFGKLCDVFGRAVELDELGEAEAGLVETGEWTLERVDEC